MLPVAGAEGDFRFSDHRGFLVSAGAAAASGFGAGLAAGKKV
jgi:hypothetical protein